MLNGINRGFCKLPVLYAAKCAELGAKMWGGHRETWRAILLSIGRTSLQSECSQDRIDVSLKSGELPIPNGIGIKD